MNPCLPYTSVTSVTVQEAMHQLTVQYIVMLLISNMSTQTTRTTGTNGFELEIVITFVFNICGLNLQLHHCTHLWVESAAIEV